MDVRITRTQKDKFLSASAGLTDNIFLALKIRKSVKIMKFIDRIVTQMLREIVKMKGMDGTTIKINI